MLWPDGLKMFTARSNLLCSMRISLPSKKVPCARRGAFCAVATVSEKNRAKAKLSQLEGRKYAKSRRLDPRGRAPCLELNEGKHISEGKETSSIKALKPKRAPRWSEERNMALCIKNLHVESVLNHFLLAGMICL